MLTTRDYCICTSVSPLDSELKFIIMLYYVYYFIILKVGDKSFYVQYLELLLQTGHCTNKSRFYLILKFLY